VLACGVCRGANDAHANDPCPLPHLVASCPPSLQALRVPDVGSSQEHAGGCVLVYWCWHPLSGATLHVPPAKGNNTSHTFWKKRSRTHIRTQALAWPTIMAHTSSSSSSHTSGSGSSGSSSSDTCGARRRRRSRRQRGSTGELLGPWSCVSLLPLLLSVILPLSTSAAVAAEAKRGVSAGYTSLLILFPLPLLLLMPLDTALHLFHPRSASFRVLY